MQAAVGDRIVVASRRARRSVRDGEIIEKVGHNSKKDGRMQEDTWVQIFWVP